MGGKSSAVVREGMQEEEWAGEMLRAAFDYLHR
jgi:hypothetical protein